jgi:hypothetical protein
MGSLIQASGNDGLETFVKYVLELKNVNQVAEEVWENWLRKNSHLHELESAMLGHDLAFSPTTEENLCGDVRELFQSFQDILLEAGLNRDQIPTEVLINVMIGVTSPPALRESLWDVLGERDLELLPFPGRELFDIFKGVSKDFLDSGRTGNESG